MWPRQSKMSLFLCTGLLSVLCALQSFSHATHDLCVEDSGDEQTTITCSCLLRDDTLIVQDQKISNSGNTSYRLPDHTTALLVAHCQDVHLSGPTLTSLSSIHTLHFHDINRLHISYDFFIQYETSLQVLKLSSTGFAPLQDSLNIHAKRMSHVLLYDTHWDGDLNLLVQINEDEQLEVLTIMNSRMKKLGEINISSRYVKRLVLQNNTIDKVLTSALMLDSQEILIENNSIGNLSFLSLDSDTQNFTLKGNTIKSLSLQSLVVNATNEIVITNNTFFYIEKYALSSLRSPYNNGSLEFSSNHLYTHEEGSLAFYSAVINKNLEIENNELHMETCDCGTQRLLDNMTLKNSIRHRTIVYELFKNTSFCCDKGSNATKLTDVCRNHPHPGKTNTGRASLIVAIMLVILCGVLILIVRSGKLNIPYKRLWIEDNELT